MSVLRVGSSRWGATRLRCLRLCPSSQRAQCHAAYCHQWRGRSVRHCAQNSRRPTHHSPSRLCDQPVHPQADRGDLRLGKIDRLDQLKVRGIEKAKTTFVFGLEDRCPLFGMMRSKPCRTFAARTRRGPQSGARGGACPYPYAGHAERGWAELGEDQTLKGQICFQGGLEADFTAKPRRTFSIAC